LLIIGITQYTPRPADWELEVVDKFMNKSYQQLPVPDLSGDHLRRIK
jgi:hypothetical protein